MMIRNLFLIGCLTFLSGCALIPERMCQITVHNPFPQLTKVGVAPFINVSHEPAVDGRQFAIAYANEVSQVAGFEIVPMGVIETAIERYHSNLSNPADVRRLAQALGIDVIVVGAVTDFSPYYPPRCGMQVEWYTANPGFHPIPPGYGLPWGTPDEKKIPGPVVFEAEMALAREQLKTQAPEYAVDLGAPATGVNEHKKPAFPDGSEPPDDSPKSESAAKKDPRARTASHEVRVETPLASSPPASGSLPPNWPDPRGFIPPPPAASKPPLIASDEPVLRHSRTFNGHDPEFTKALENYVFFRDDARFGGWQSYLQRSDDFIRFCCYLHLHEMLASRGGAGETRVVWRWGTDR
ncbi:MAG TPA: hypothetical protein VFE24_06010 [Pirellulales bacterium]|jgi:hypothetical protein|nr:hypothetical protein [Pirellulales bacterium]